MNTSISYVTFQISSPPSLQSLTHQRRHQPQPRTCNMTVYSFYLFNRSGVCLIYNEWKRPHQVHSADDDQKHMFGMLFALRDFSIKLSSPPSPSPSPSPSLAPPSSTTKTTSDTATPSQPPSTMINIESPGIQGLPKYFITDSYALHYFETPTGLRFVLTTSTDFGQLDVSKHLSHIYASIYVQYVVKNPLYTPFTPISIPVFSSKLDEYIRQLPCF